MARSVGRVGVDTAGGVLMSPIVPNVFVNGAPIAVEFTPVSPHGKGPHGGSFMTHGSPLVVAGGSLVNATGDLASCGHPLLSTSNVFIG